MLGKLPLPRRGAAILWRGNAASSHSKSSSSGEFANCKAPPYPLIDTGARGVMMRAPARHMKLIGRKRGGARFAALLSLPCASGPWWMHEHSPRHTPLTKSTHEAACALAVVPRGCCPKNLTSFLCIGNSYSLASRRQIGPKSQTRPSFPSATKLVGGAARG